MASGDLLSCVLYDCVSVVLGHLHASAGCMGIGLWGRLSPGRKVGAGSVCGSDSLEVSRERRGAGRRLWSFSMAMRSPLILRVINVVPCVC